MQVRGIHRDVLSSTLTRPANTTAYAQNDLIADNVTAGSIIVPHFTPARDEASLVEILGGSLWTDLTTGFTTFQGHIELFSRAPTFTNGDNGAFAIATGSEYWVGHLTTDVSSAHHATADGAFLDVVKGNSATAPGGERIFWSRKPGDVLYWALRELDATGFTPIASQRFRLDLFVDQE